MCASGVGLLQPMLIVVFVGVVASFSFGGGLAIWPTVLCLGWFLRLPRRCIGVLITAGLAASVVFALLPEVFGGAPSIRAAGFDFVFPAVTSPTAPLAYNTVENSFRRIRAKAGVERCTLHTIRHWFATMTANSVSNQRVGMALTGHKSHAAYMNYVHGDKEQARALAEQLAALADAPSQSETYVTKFPIPCNSTA